MKQVHRNAPADMDGELGLGVYLWGCGLELGVASEGLVMLFLGDRILSVNGQTVRHHQHASELIRSGPMVVSLLVEKADKDSPPDMSEGLGTG